MAAITQLTPSAIPGRRYGSFAAKVAGSAVAGYGFLFGDLALTGPFFGRTALAGPFFGDVTRAGTWFGLQDDSM